jgi:hypothetical protein
MAMKTDKEEMNIGILDIYGFEIFEVRLTCYMICFRLLFYWVFFHRSPATNSRCLLVCVL